MRNDSITFNNHGIHESCETVVFDESHQEICEFIFALRSIQNSHASIQLMGHEQFQLIQVSNNRYVLAPIGWEGCDEDEADINTGGDGSTGDHYDDSKPEPECPRVREQTNQHAPRCCAH